MAAVDAIIHRLIDELAGFVDVTALRGLPAAYTDAMKSAGELWASATHLLGAPRSHQEILSRIDNVATAIGVRLVLWVEDLERFCNSGLSRDGDTDESPEDSARLGPIRALLHGLGTLRSITVVTAITTLKNRSNLAKIAQIVEAIPELEDRATARVLSAFRNGCRADREYVDPATSQVRAALDRLNDSDSLAGRHAFVGPGVYDIIDAILVLCRLPRTLKQGLRQCLDTWEVLAGEIDFDDLLLLSLLREASPDAFALVREWSEYQRMPTSSRNLQKEKEEARQAWGENLKRLALRADLHEAVQQIDRFIFDEKHETEKPQGLTASRHADYWQRFLSQSIPKNQVRDQDVLRIIVTYEEGDSALLNLLDNPDASNAVLDFRFSFPRKEFLGFW